MKKVLLIMIVFSLFLFISCSQGKEPDVEEKPIEETNKDNNEPSNIELPDIKEKYELYMLNGKLVSGDSDMYDFYNLTKEGHKLSITITFTYEKDYLNSVKAQSDPEVTEGYTNIDELSFDGDNFIYYKLGSNEKYSYKYLNYSEDGVYGGSQVYSKRVSYVIADDSSVTYESLMRIALSSIRIDDSLFRAMPIVTFLYYDDLAFNRNKITNISYVNNDIETGYYSNALVLKDTVDVLNELEWMQISGYDVDSLNSNKEKISITISRHLVNDKNNIMLHTEAPNIKDDTYLLTYIFYLDDNYVIMFYNTDFVTGFGNYLFAQLNEEQEEKIRGILKEELIYDFSLGEYTFTSHPVGEKVKYYVVKLKENNIANIYCYPQWNAYDNYIMDGTSITKGTYSIERREIDSFDSLVITDGTYTYRFRLSNNGNKGIWFEADGSIVPDIFSERVKTRDTFYYDYGHSASSYAYLSRFSVYDLGEPRLENSDLLKEYVKYSKTSQPDDVLYNVTPLELSNICTIYKFDKSCATFLEYNGKIYQMGVPTGGYGVTQLAYYDTIDTTLLYYINSWGSGIHRSEVFAFDFDDEEIKRVKFDKNDSKSMNYDIAFEVEKTNTGFNLSIYKSTYTVDNYPFSFTKTNEEMIIANILDLELIYKAFVSGDNE